ncbi:MAG: barstar family protein [Clostridia bacterium]|nr:barstar family protein [Clostridia bacterium]MBQ4574644.1 barstar family protein [Clostridia bacterium]
MTNYTLNFNQCKIKDDVLAAVAGGLGSSERVDDWGDVWHCLTDDRAPKHISLKGLESMAESLADQMDIMLQIFACYKKSAKTSVVEVEVGGEDYPITGYFKA